MTGRSDMQNQFSPLELAGYTGAVAVACFLLAWVLWRHSAAQGADPQSEPGAGCGIGLVAMLGFAFLGLCGLMLMAHFSN